MLILFLLQNCLRHTNQKIRRIINIPNNFKSVLSKNKLSVKLKLAIVPSEETSRDVLSFFLKTIV